MKRILGISSWCFPWSIGVRDYPRPVTPLGPLELIQRARGLGVSLVQFADNLPLDSLSDRELGALDAAAREQGIGIETGTKGVDPDTLLRYLDISARLGSRLLRTLTHSSTAQPSLAEVEASLRKVLPAFEAAGVVLAIENYERHSAEELADLMRRLDSRNLGVCLDTVNNFGALEHPDKVAAILAPYTACLHYKDFGMERIDHQMGFIVSGRPAGQGRLNARDLFSLLDAHGRPYTVVIEQWPPYLGSIDATVANETSWAESSVRYLGQFFS